METHPANVQDREIAGTGGARVMAAAATKIPTPPATPKCSTPRSMEIGSTFPTTFVQADTSTFKQVVQMLTGSGETTAKHAAAPPPPPTLAGKAPGGPKRQPFKLYERRSSMKNLKMIPLVPAAAIAGARKPEILSPSTLDFPSLVLSPVTPLIADPFNRQLGVEAAASTTVEDRAIAEKGFYLHPSPRTTTPRDGEPPRLLPLFPLTSPRASSSSASSPSP